MKPISPLRILKALQACALILALMWLLYPLTISLKNKKTVADQIEKYEPKVIANLQPLLTEQNVAYPPRNITLLFIKSKKTLALYAPDSINEMKLVKTYPVLAASGKPGPKLQDGDYQVPEGIYSIESLNPNSAFHLSLRVDYPNEVDLKHAKEEGRTNLGSDIMIHGDKVSIGCIAIGDEAVEELFVLAAKSNYRNWKLISSPVDFRLGEIPKPPRKPVAWLPKLYQSIAENMSSLP